MQHLPDVDESRQMTKRCLAYIEQQGVPQTFAALSRHIGVDEKTVRAICNSKFERLLAKQREACAKIADQVGADADPVNGTRPAEETGKRWAADHIAWRIRNDMGG